MSENPFHGMSVSQMVDSILYSEHPGHTDWLFDRLQLLDEETRKTVLDLTEKHSVDDVVDSFKRTTPESPIVRAFWAAAGWEAEKHETQAFLRIFTHLADIRGETADPVIKAVAREMAALSHDEYHSPDGLYAAATRAVESLHPPSKIKGLAYKPPTP